MSAQPRRMLLKGWRPYAKNTLRGFATVELPIGLTIRDLPVHTKGGKSWASLPAKPVVAQDGSLHKVNGKQQYAAILDWRDRDLSDRFSAAVVALVAAAHPGALDGEPG